MTGGRSDDNNKLRGLIMKRFRVNIDFDSRPSMLNEEIIMKQFPALGIQS